ncbi:MAG: tetratricopeptide repeat protein [Planctomycetota bacterium]|nr:tetratricopeptide repeat protein [Planctomycetota bacterium]
MIMKPVHSDPSSTLVVSRSDVRRRGSSAFSVILACTIIVALIAAGLWLASRYAKQVIEESRVQTGAKRLQVEDAFRQGMMEAEAEEAELDDEPVTTPVQEEHNSVSSEIVNWMRLVNSFLAQEVLAGATNTKDGSPTMSQTLDRASARLEENDSYPPAVEAAIHTLLAHSYLNLDRTDDALAHAQMAMDILRLAYGQVHDYSRQAQRNLGAIRLHQHRFDEAMMDLQTLYEMRLAALGPDDPLSAATMRMLRMLRLYEADLMGNDDHDSWPGEIRNLLEDLPDCCRFGPLEF